jgi:[ribosomal protein S5]-alanine N-acetyltransferase
LTTEEKPRINFMKLVPIGEKLEDNMEFLHEPSCSESLFMTIEFFKKVGYVKPWIGYYAKVGNNIVGSAAYKGAPVNGSVEIAYGTFEAFRKKGIGTQICKMLVDLAVETDPTIRITARTLPEKNFSTKILSQNNFECLGTVNDPEDGEVWEWEYRKE